MKNTFAVTMTLLLALTIGGSLAGYRIATTPHHEGGAAAEEAHGAAEASPATTTTKGDGVVSEQEAAVNMGESEPLAAPGGTGPNVVQDRDLTNLQNRAGGPNAGVTDQVPETGKVAGDDTGTPGGNTDVSAAQTDTGNNAEQSPGGVSGDKSASPTAEGGQGTELGQTGSSNTEKAAAGSPGLSDSKAAETASALSGDTAEGQRKFVASCGGCHGQNAEGAMGPAMNSAQSAAMWMVSQFETAVREGHAPDRELGAVMPRFTEEQLSDEDLTDIYAYLKSLVQ